MAARKEEKMSHTRKLTEVFLEYRQKNQKLKWNTLDSYSRAWNKLIEAKGDIMVSDFGYNDAEDFQSYLFEQGLRAGAVKSNVKMVKCIMNWSWRRGYREGDPFNGLRLPKVPQKEIRVFTDAELCAMLCSANIFWQARIIAAGSAGLRRSEALNLKVSDVDFDRGEIKIQANKESRETWPYCPKDYESRRLPLTEELNRLLVRILNDEIPAGQPYLLISEKRYWWLQHLRSQSKMSSRMMVNPDENFSRPFQRILRIAKISDGTYRDLRSTAITRWLLAGLVPQEVQRLAGHSDIQTTMYFYAACRPDIVDRARRAWAIGATGLEPATS